jgi:hypothetical protein
MDPAGLSQADQSIHNESAYQEDNMWKRRIPVIPCIFSIACFFLFFQHERLDPDGLHKRAHVPPAWETKAAFSVGLPFSPWLFYKTDDSQPIQRRFSGIKVYPLSVSWFLALAGFTTCFTACLWSTLKERRAKPEPEPELETLL